MPTTEKDTVLVQSQIARKLHNKLTVLMKASGDLSMAAYVRRVLAEHVKQQEESHGKK